MRHNENLRECDLKDMSWLFFGHFAWDEPELCSLLSGLGTLTAPKAHVNG